MKSKPRPAASLKRAPTQKQLNAMCLGAQSLLRSLGATPAEVALLHQSSGDRHAAALAIAAMMMRMEGGAAN